MSEQLHLFRLTDPEASQEGATKAQRAMGRHKQIIMDWFTRADEKALFAHTNGAQGKPYVEITARELAEQLYHQGYVTLHEIDTLRRRVSDLADDGRLVRVYRGKEPAKFRLVHTQTGEQK